MFIQFNDRIKDVDCSFVFLTDVFHYSFPQVLAPKKLHFLTKFVHTKYFVFAPKSSHLAPKSCFWPFWQRFRTKKELFCSELSNNCRFVPLIDVFLSSIPNVLAPKHTKFVNTKYFVFAPKSSHLTPKSCFWTDHVLMYSWVHSGTLRQLQERIYNSIILLDNLVRNSYYLVLKRCQYGLFRNKILVLNENFLVRKQNISFPHQKSSHLAPKSCFWPFWQRFRTKKELFCSELSNNCRFVPVTDVPLFHSPFQNFDGEYFITFLF